MFDRKLLSDIGLAALIALPSMLPASALPQGQSARIAAEGPPMVVPAQSPPAIAGTPS